MQSFIGLIDDLPSTDGGTRQDSDEGITSIYNSHADAIHDEETTDAFMRVDTFTDEPATLFSIDICCCLLAN